MKGSLLKETNCQSYNFIITASKKIHARLHERMKWRKAQPVMM